MGWNPGRHGFDSRPIENLHDVETVAQNMLTPQEAFLSVKTNGMPAQTIHGGAVLVNW